MASNDTSITEVLTFHCETEIFKVIEGGVSIVWSRCYIKNWEERFRLRRAKDETQEDRAPLGQQRETLRFVDPRYAITHYVHKQGACSKEGMTTG